MKSDIPWLPDDDYAKALGQLKLQVLAVLSVFDCYGLDIYTPGAAAEIVRLAEDFGLRVRGIKDKPISLERVRRK